MEIKFFGRKLKTDLAFVLFYFTIKLAIIAIDNNNR